MRILLIDEDATFRGYVRKVLADKGHIVEEAPQSQEALELAEKTRYDLFIIEQKAAGARDGLWLARELRSTGQAGGILMIGGETFEEDFQNSYRAGADEYIVKPFRIPELVAKVEGWKDRLKSFLLSDVDSTIDSPDGPSRLSNRQ